tara:strand:+ start:7139 stop:8248 length:1110 start_codon:yes stop_codon:yes gene_type:complete
MTEVFAHDFISDQSMPHVALNDRELGKYLLKDGDLVFARRSLKPEGAGDVALVSPTGAMSFESSIIRARLKKDISSRFVLEYLKSPYGKAQMMTLVRQVAVSGITGEDLKKYQIPIPPLPEQKKIAQILSTWDQAITATERLLENSQQRKKGLMQQLLTGKKRLPGFEGEWVSSRLDELFTFKKGKGLSKSALVENGNHKCVLYGELYTKYGEVIRDVVSRCDDQDGLASKRGDILLPSSTTTNGIDLANATAVIEDGILLGGDIIVLRPIKQQDPIFFSHLITHIKKHEIAARAQGITIIHLYGSDLKDLVVKIPAKEAEQKVISEIMTTADKEIVGLSQRLASLKQEKKALMQQLLTGKRRVQVEAA